MGFISNLFLMLLLVFSACKARKVTDQSLLNANETSESSMFEYLKPANLAKNAEEIAFRSDVKANAQAFQIESGELASATGHGGVQLSKQDDGKYRRQDRFTVGSETVPGMILQQAQDFLPISFKIKAGREIVVTRQFSSLKDALSSLPMRCVDLPLTADKALRVQEGTFVSLPAYLGVTLGASTGGVIPQFAANASSAVFWSGEFRVNIYRLNGSYARIKIGVMDTRGNINASSAGSALRIFGYGPFGVLRLDRHVERLVGLDFAAFTRQNVKDGGNLTLDYIFNLGQPDGRLAFDSVLLKTLRPKATLLASQGVHGEIDDSTTFADVTPAEYLAISDSHLPPAKRRVVKVVSGERDYNQLESQWHIGTKALRKSGRTSSGLNRLRFSTGLEEYTVDYPVTKIIRQQTSWLSSLRFHDILEISGIFNRKSSLESHLAQFSIRRSISQNEVTADEWSAIATSLGVSLQTELLRLGVFLNPSGMPNGVKDLSATYVVSLKPELFRRLMESRALYPDFFEKSLVYVSLLLSERFRGRYGNTTPGASQSVHGFLSNVSVKTMNFSIDAAKNMLTLNWSPHSKKVLDQLTQSIKSANSADLAPTLSQQIDLVSKEPILEELLTAFYIELSSVYNVPPYVDLSIRDAVNAPVEKTSGTDEQISFAKYVEQAFFDIHYFGFEG